MKTIRKLTDRKLDKLEDRLSKKYWNWVDVSPGTPNKLKVRMINRLIAQISRERLRRLGVDVSRPVRRYFP